ncbi:MAG: azurin [Chiayiivirga sp.]|uniref:Azurin n=1 Tax=Denitratimonas tolerans TaxID=1338420 RepID=A0AAW9R3N3_9GAMM|nr:azurin [Xanthomonadaceae bacterium]MDX9764217.1 azurin [Chiayiivirga sp.]
MRSSLLAIAALLLSTQLQAKTCELSIDSTDQMTFSAKELSVGADCTEVKLTLHHVGKLAKNVMGHNWVLTKTADYQPVAQDGMKAGLDADYLKADDDRVIAHTALIGGGETTSVTFPVSKLEKGGDYTFFCSFPGHWAVMHGKLVFGG